MLDRHWRAGVEKGLQPLGERLRRIGVTPDALTGFGLVASAVTAILIGSGHLIFGAVGIAVSGLGDLLDGAVARRTGQATARGAFFDSVADRVSDALLLGGVAWYLAPRNPHLPVLVLAVAGLSMVISYERAKAESLGLQARGGLMERAERFVFLGAGCLFGILVPVLWVMLVLTAVTASQRFVIVWRQADRPVRPPRPQRDARREARRERRPFRSPGHEGSTPALRQWWETRRPRDRDRSKPRHLSSRRRTRP
ncbi:MAG TPA: CDP-alcohol phosphatidyltransferase family protein [Acidimicrobiia bacterium]|jgi:CDP-diacylglycerol--glycerol-3-phosphate 3-phosphatidyltransferase|nr:CDP-alcohol phosphatidyltransferase family protein [Acidimicrobiia bacterium]